MTRKIEIITAENAGFCFGVKRAVEMVEDSLSAGLKVSTLGPIIHNPQIVSRLSQKGVVIAEDVRAIPAGYTLVIRSHGALKEDCAYLEANGIPYKDATCPYVKKIHNIADKYSKKGYTLLIAGDKNHPEIKAIVSYAHKSFTFNSREELENILKADIKNVNDLYIMVSQTTFNIEEWEKCVYLAKNVCTNLEIFDTICNATIERQLSAERLSKESDIMIVIGGKNSSNTAKLAEICAESCRTVLVEDPPELYNHDFKKAKVIGITAGASTPAFIIKEVQKIMGDIVNNHEEQSFEEMLNESFKTISTREKVTAIVTNVSPSEIAVDIGTKHAGYIPYGEYTDTPGLNLEDEVKIGDQLELIVLRVNDVEGTAMLSKKRLDAIAGFEKIIEAETSGEIINGVVTEIIKGGVIAAANGVKVFIPASQTMIPRDGNLEELLKKEVEFKIIEVNKQRKRAIGSIRAVQAEKRKEREKAFWEDAAVDKSYTGTVKSITSYGAFVDIGGVDGMVHISQLSWGKIKHPSEVVKIGDAVEVYIREMDTESKKISLGYKKTEDNPWELLKTKYQPGDTAAVKIVSIMPFGAFAQLIPGIDGLIHISQLSDKRVDKVEDAVKIGDEVDAKIIDINYEQQRISLSIRALLEPPVTEKKEPAPVKEEAPPLVMEFGPPEEKAPEEKAPEAAPAGEEE